MTAAVPQYDWPNKYKELVVAAMGLDQKLYPFIDVCHGQRSETSARILPLPQQLPDCVPGASLPADANMNYVRRFMPLI